jgi:hypothetical protein
MSTFFLVHIVAPATPSWSSWVPLLIFKHAEPSLDGVFVFIVDSSWNILPQIFDYVTALLTLAQMSHSENGSHD